MSGLLERHLGFLEALRGAGMPVSLSEGLDAVAALGTLGWGDREQVRTVYAATLVKRQPQRVTFEALFDLWFPRMIGSGVAGTAEDEDPVSRDNGAALEAIRDQLVEALADGGEQEMLDVAADAMARFGAMPGRGPGLASWSAYQAMNRVGPNDLAQRIIDALLGQGMDAEAAERTAGRRLGRFAAMVEEEGRRRIAEEKGPRHVGDATIRPTIDRLDFMSARKADLTEMRREIYPLARRLATRLTQEHHARRRGPLDFRRTVRASVSTGGVPLTTHHKPKRPHRNELVVLCDVSGSVANFAQFTLMLVFALRDQFTKVRAFTFIDHVHEVTSYFEPGADLVEVMERLAASTSHAALWGRTNYGRAFTKFMEGHADALGPKSSLLILGDARSNYSDLALDVLRDMEQRTRHAWWLNPEHTRNWGNGDSAAHEYAEIVPMVECRNLTQLGEFVHDVL